MRITSNGKVVNTCTLLAQIDLSYSDKPLSGMTQEGKSQQMFTHSIIILNAYIS